MMHNNACVDTVCMCVCVTLIILVGEYTVNNIGGENICMHWIHVQWMHVNVSVKLLWLVLFKYWIYYLHEHRYTLLGGLPKVQPRIKILCFQVNIGGIYSYYIETVK